MGVVGPDGTHHDSVNAGSACCNELALTEGRLWDPLVGLPTAVFEEDESNDCSAMMLGIHSIRWSCVIVVVRDVDFGTAADLCCAADTVSNCDDMAAEVDTCAVMPAVGSTELDYHALDLANDIVAEAVATRP